jgi:hypothetical protein
MNNRHILYERKSIRIERDEDGSCHFVQTLRNGPFYELPISRWRALFFILAAEMEDAINEPVGRCHTPDAIAQLVAVLSKAEVDLTRPVEAAPPPVFTP